MRTFKVKNFERFQHYKDRAPPWIKLYNELLDDYEFGLLQDASKYHLIAIWLLASRSENKIPYDQAWVSKRINSTGPVDLDELHRRGFIIVDQEVQSADHAASKPLARCSSEREGEAQDQKIVGGVESTRGKSQISEEAFRTSTDILIAMGLDPEHPLSVGSPLTVQGWLNIGWNSECILVGVKRSMSGRKHDPPTTLKYFEKAIARAHAELTPSVPQVEIRQPEKLTVIANGKSESLAGVAARLAESGVTFGERPRGLRPDEGGDNVRLLSKG